MIKTELPDTFLAMELIVIDQPFHPKSVSCGVKVPGLCSSAYLFAASTLVSQGLRRQHNDCPHFAYRIRPIPRHAQPLAAFPFQHPFPRVLAQASETLYLQLRLIPC